MPATTNKQTVLTHLLTALKKKGEPADPEKRPVLEQLLYGVVREGVTREQADPAFRKLQSSFFDWNEVRVSSEHEIEEALAGLPDALGRAQRIIALLQEVFEKEYSFDLDGIGAKGLKHAEKELHRYQSAGEYPISLTIQQSLGGHAIPLDEPSARVLARLGLIEEGQHLDKARASLEHLVPKAKGLQFCDVVSVVAKDWCWEEAPNCPACPMRADCPTGQAVLAARAEEARPARKPR